MPDDTRRFITFKKALAIILTMTMLLCVCFPVYAAQDDNTAQPEATETRTVEEILTEYHQKAFAAEQTENETVSTYSRRSGSGEQNLEQEAVDELTAAGYEAYNVTPDNYEELQESLQTDLSQMELDPDSSYIIVISGEDTEENEEDDSSSKSRIVELPNYDYDIGDGGPSSNPAFSYTYNGETYIMRYVTVSATSDNYLYVSSSYILSSAPNVEDYLSNLFTATLNTSTSIAADSLFGAPIGTIASLLAETFDDDNFTVLDPDDLIIHAATAWTQVFIQIWDEQSSCWRSAQSSSYAQSFAFCAGYLLNKGTGLPEQFIGNEQQGTTYSPKYNTVSQRKIDAVNAYLSGSITFDTTGDIDFYLVDESGTTSISGGTNPLFSHAEYLLTNY